METGRRSKPITRANDAVMPIRVMLVDDSAIIRGFMRRVLESDRDILIVASVANGLQAIKELQWQKNIDTVVLDVEMPVMDGLTALAKLIQIDPDLQVIMASTLTQRNAQISLRALELGAIDYVPKPTTQKPASNDEFFRDLLRKVKVLGAARCRRRPSTIASRMSTISAHANQDAPTSRATKPTPPLVTLRAPSRLCPEVVIIGASTGGPQALLALLQALPCGCFKQPILIAQHMPPTFTTIFAEHLQRHSGWPCAEAVDGESLRPARLYLAPGDYHLLVEGVRPSVRLRLSKDDPENYCRPAIDPLLRSVAEVFAGRATAVILTGMGADGCKGSQALVAAGGTILAQDERSSVVWGMPGAVANAGLCSAVQPLPELARTLISLATRPA